ASTGVGRSFVPAAPMVLLRSAACCVRTTSRWRCNGVTSLAESIVTVLCPLPRRTVISRRWRSTSFTRSRGHADVIPIAAELVPYLEAAMDASPCELLFPRADGSMQREDVDLSQVLRCAL